jgi:hypothetical protein
MQRDKRRPMPTGELPPTALERLAEVGDWMDVNGEAIHDTTPQSPYVSVLGFGFRFLVRVGEGPTLLFLPFFGRRERTSIHPLRGAPYLVFPFTGPLVFPITVLPWSSQSRSCLGLPIHGPRVESRLPGPKRAIRAQT